MNKVKFYFILSLISMVLFSCNEDDNSSVIRPLKPYEEQYPIDIDSIESYLKTHSFRSNIALLMHRNCPQFIHLLLIHTL